MTVSAPPSPVRTLELLGNTLTFHATHADTNGAWSLVEYRCAPHFVGPPVHVHDTFAEAFFVLEGTLAMTLDGRRLDVPAGTLARVPAGSAHTFSNPREAPARFLVFCTPGGFEQYFLDLADLVASTPTWPPEDPAALRALSARYDQREPAV